MIQDVSSSASAVEHRGIVVAPLFPRRDPVADYVTLDEALPRGLRITEVDEAGTVPELVVENPLDARVLLYDGEELVGAKQNRILNVSVLVGGEVEAADPGLLRRAGTLVARVGAVRARAATSRTRSCGGARRRRRPRSRSRAASRRATSGTRCTSGWSRCSVDSPTGASSDLYRARERDLRALEDAFPAQPGQCGAFLGLGDDMCVDVVSRPDAFARLWPKLRAGYLLDALERLDGPPTPFAVVLDVPRAGRARPSGARQPSVGLGEDVRLRGERVIGSGLELDGELIQLSAFTTDDGGRRAFGRIARPSARR